MRRCADCLWWLAANPEHTHGVCHEPDKQVWDAQGRRAMQLCTAADDRCWAYIDTVSARALATGLRAQHPHAAPDAPYLARWIETQAPRPPRPWSIRDWLGRLTSRDRCVQSVARRGAHASDRPVL